MTTFTSLPAGALRFLRAAGEPTRISLNAQHTTRDHDERAAHLASVAEQINRAAGNLAVISDSFGAAELRGMATMAALCADIERAACARHASAGGGS